MKWQRIVPITALLGLCACATYQTIGVNKAIEVLTSIKEYTNADVPTSLKIASTCLVYDNGNNVIKSEENVYEMLYSTQRMHILTSIDEKTTLEIYSGKKDKINYIFLENNDEKKYYEVESTLYGMIILNYLGIMQNRFNDESNISSNMTILNKIKKDNPSKDTYRLTSNGKGNLKMSIQDKTNKTTTTYDLYRFLMREDIFYAANYINETTNGYELETGEDKRIVETTMIYKKIQITLPEKDDYTKVNGNPDLPSSNSGDVR